MGNLREFIELHLRRQEIIISRFWSLPFDEEAVMFRKCFMGTLLAFVLFGFAACELPFELPFELPSLPESMPRPEGSGGGSAGGGSIGGGQTAQGSGNQNPTGAGNQNTAGGGGGTGGGSGTPRPVTPASRVRVPQTGANSIVQDGATVDISNISSGYFMVRFDGDITRFVTRVEHASAQQISQFFLRPGAWQTIPLTYGNGAYTVTILEEVTAGMFAEVLSTNLSVSLSNPLLPFLYPNIFVNFTPQTRAVQLSAELAEGATSELDVVQAVYDFVIQNIAYDAELATRITAGMVSEHSPDLDDILRRGRGICFDYAALMAAMLRAQQIPTRLEIGFVSGGIFHAWVTIHTAEHGWVGVAQFSQGANWTRMDPTFSASNEQSQQLAQFVGDGSNYQTVFIR